MSTLTQVDIRTDEVFPHLPRAPIVEAVIDLRVRASREMEEGSSRSALEPQLEGYRFLNSQREYLSEMKVEGGKPPSQNVRDLGWKGLQFQSADQKHIAQFNRDGFVFSRLQTYAKWQQLQNEALRLWGVFKAHAEPVEINRIGLRFINRIPLPPGELRFENYIRPTPEPPRDFELPFLGFMHQDTLAVPGHPYAINVVRTIQPSVATAEAAPAVILDIDVFTTQEFEMDDATVTKRLAEMRWLKNKVFFGSVTETALKRFQ